MRKDGKDYYKLMHLYDAYLRSQLCNGGEEH